MKNYILDEDELTELIGLWLDKCRKIWPLFHSIDLAFPAARVREGYKAMSRECPQWPEYMGDREVDVGDRDKTPIKLYQAKNPSHVCKDPRPFEGHEAKLKGFGPLDPHSSYELTLLNELWHWAIHESKKKAFILAQNDEAESAA